MPQDKYLNIAKEIVLSLIDKEKVTVFLFGSRADGEYRSDSDLDIGFVADEKIDLFVFTQIREALNNSIVPYRFDLVDFSVVSDDFKKIAMNRIIEWNIAKNTRLN